MQRLVSCIVMMAIVLFAAAPATAQTIRFQTSVGAFDMLLNPTGDANLQPLVDNMLANVGAGVYHRNVVNRAPDGFVLQLGGFTTESILVDEIPSTGFAAVDSFDSIVVDRDGAEDGGPDGIVDFATQSNIRGTVSLALSGNPNSGSSSFFINIGDSSFLDSQGFVPFATISNMSVVDRIMGLSQIDLSGDVVDGFLRDGNGNVLRNNDGSPQKSPAYEHVPLAEDGELLVIESATVVSQSSFSFTGPLRTAFNLGTDTPANGSASSSAATSAASDGDAPSFLSASDTFTPPASSSINAVPEPTSIALATMGVFAAMHRRRR